MVEKGLPKMQKALGSISRNKKTKQNKSDGLIQDEGHELSFLKWLY